MLQFKGLADLKHLPASNPAYTRIKDLVDRLIIPPASRLVFNWYR